MEEKRIYAVVAATVQTARGSIVQPPGRQIAQACHVVSKLRHELQPSNGVRGYTNGFESITTIILQARDSAELQHIQLLLSKNDLDSVSFFDTNDQYGTLPTMTAVATFITPGETTGITDYLPLWGRQ
jgi:hypothetical protein